MPVQETLRLKDWAVATTLWGCATSDLGGRLIDVNPAFLRRWSHASADAVLREVARASG